MGARGVFISWRSGGGGGGGCNMMAVVIPAGWLALMLLMLFPASAIARMGPGNF
jgi:hypothetical protein